MNHMHDHNRKRLGRLPGATHWKETGCLFAPLIALAWFVCAGIALAGTQSDPPMTILESTTSRMVVAFEAGEPRLQVLRSGGMRFAEYTIAQAKRHMQGRGIEVRL